jgi:hypothetical protein
MARINGGRPNVLDVEPGLEEHEPIAQVDCPFCGYRHPEALGRYGCPNCLGEGPDAAAEMDEWDPTGYYRRKEVQRAPNAAAAGVCAILAAAIALGAALAKAIGA